MMYRFFKWPIYLVVCLVWMSGAHAADVSGTPSPSDSKNQAAQGAADSQKAPVIHILEPSHHLGEVAEGTLVNHAFKIKNTGTEVLQIERVRPG